MPCELHILGDEPTKASAQNMMELCTYNDYVRIFPRITHKCLHKIEEINSTVTHIWLQRHLCSKLSCS
jgi:hypothetical protein